jgi:hypothetical protein
MVTFAARIQPGQGSGCTSRAHADYLKLMVSEIGRGGMLSSINALQTWQSFFP